MTKNQLHNMLESINSSFGIQGKQLNKIDLFELATSMLPILGMRDKNVKGDRLLYLIGNFYLMDADAPQSIIDKEITDAVHKVMYVNGDGDDEINFSELTDFIWMLKVLQKKYEDKRGIERGEDTSLLNSKIGRLISRILELGAIILSFTTGRRSSKE